MTATPIATAPVRIAGKLYQKGEEIDPELIGDQRLARLISKGRCILAGTPVPETNRAEAGGRPAATLPERPEANKGDKDK